MFKIIIVLAAAFITGQGEVITREFTGPLQGVPTYNSLNACRAGILADDNKIVAAAGPRLKKFLEENAADIGADKVRRGVFRVRCGKDALDTVDE
jgi:enoyl-[acyl-carrier-protein] reductase (NADH)